MYNYVTLNVHIIKLENYTAAQNCVFYVLVDGRDKARIYGRENEKTGMKNEIGG